MVCIGLTMDEVTMPIQRVDMKRYCLSTPYVDAILGAGGIPLVLPHIDRVDVAQHHARIIDGLLLTGGGDVNPRRYGALPAMSTGINDKRDSYEVAIVRMMLDMHKPILAICRGVQLLNVALGGSLHEDTSLIQGNVLKHWQDAPIRETCHQVKLKSGSHLRNIFDSETISVNSVHHQCCNQVADCFEVTARSEDGVVEAIEHRTASMVLGVQWHPEHLGSSMKSLFLAFVDSCTSN